MSYTFGTFQLIKQLIKRLYLFCLCFSRNKSLIDYSHYLLSSEFSIDIMKTKIQLVVLFLVLSFVHPAVVAGSNIYQHVDKEGNVTFSNRPIGSAKKIYIGSYSPRKYASNSPALKSFSSPVKDSMQKERNVMRQQILKKELTTEIKLLAATLDHLDEVAGEHQSAQQQEKTVQLKNKLSLHRRNIAALRKELGQ